MIDLIASSQVLTSPDKRRRPGSSKLFTCSEAQLGVIHLAVANGSKVHISDHPHRENAAARTNVCIGPSSSKAARSTQGAEADGWCCLDLFRYFMSQAFSCRHPLPWSATVMGVTAVLLQTHRERHDKSARRTRKQGRRTSMARTCGFRPI